MSPHLQSEVRAIGGASLGDVDGGVMRLDQTRERFSSREVALGPDVAVAVVENIDHVGGPRPDTPDFREVS